MTVGMRMIIYKKGWWSGGLILHDKLHHLPTQVCLLFSLENFVESERYELWTWNKCGEDSCRESMLIIMNIIDIVQ